MQLELNLERLRMAVDDLLIKLAKMFPKPKQQTVFLINNYDMTIAVLKVTNTIYYLRRLKKPIFFLLPFSERV